MIPSQDGILRLPLWAKRDDIIQRIIDKEEVDQVVYYGDYSQKRRSSPPARTVSSSPEISAEKKAKALLDFERHCKRGRKRKRDSSPVWLDLNQGRSRNTTEDDNDPASASIERITALSDIQSHLAAAPPTQRTGRCRSETISTLELDLAKRASRLHASYTKKRSRSCTSHPANWTMPKRNDLDSGVGPGQACLASRLHASYTKKRSRSHE